MTHSSNNYGVGHGRPPVKTRWKKGQSGNPRGRALKRAESVLAMIDRLLQRPIQLSINGEPQKRTALEAILFQLLRKALSGNIRALRVLRKYEEFAIQNGKKELQLIFLESDYTRAFALLGSTHER